MADVYVSRQPIFNPYNEVFGYELLYDAYQTDHNVSVDEDLETMQVVINTFSDMGFDSMVGGAKAFIRLTRNFITGRLPIPFPSKKVVIEVSENVEVDNQLIEALKILRDNAYELALENLAATKHASALIDVVQYAKINIQVFTRPQIEAVVPALKRKGIKAIAEKVETIDDYNYCKTAGFDFFEGYYLCKPDMVKGRHLDSSRLILMRSLAKLQDPQTNFPELEEIVTQDVTLGYKLLKLVNSAYYSLSTPVKSIGQAISFIGLTQLRGWMMLLLLASVKNKPHELTTIALVRSKMGEMLAKTLGEQKVDAYFLVGLLSVLDAYLDLPIEQAIKGLPISEEITDALINHGGRIGLVLETILAYEQGDFSRIVSTNISPDVVRSLFFKSLQWASSITGSIRGSGVP